MARTRFEIYFPAFGGKFLNMLLMSPSTILVFLSSFEERFSVARPLHSSFFELPSNRSITRLPTLCSVVVVVAMPVPKPGSAQPPPQPHPPQPQPPPQPKPMLSYIVCTCC